VIEIYDIRNGKLKYSAYTFYQLCEMVREDFVYHATDAENDVVDWIEEKAAELSAGPQRQQVLDQLQSLLTFAEQENQRPFAARIGLLLGSVLLEDGPSESALGYLEKAVSLTPRSVVGLRQLARGLAVIGQYEKAAEALRKANGILPSEKAYVALVSILEKLKRPDEREKVLRSLLRNYPRSIIGMHMLARLCREHGRHKVAARLAQRIVDFRPDADDSSTPFFPTFAEALIWSKYSYDARKLNPILELLDEEQERNPDRRLSLLKAVMLYKLDRRICREEVCRELQRYFNGIAYDPARGGGMTEDLQELVEVFGQVFSRGVVRFIRNQFARFLLEGEKHSLPRSASSPRTPSAEHMEGEGVEGRRNVRRRVNLWEECLSGDAGGSN